MEPVINLEIDILVPGQKILASAEGDGPLLVEIYCFTNKPRPPGFKPCPECGSFKVFSGQSFDVVANNNLFSLSEGYLDITVTDVMGKKAVKRIDVLTDYYTHD